MELFAKVPTPDLNPDSSPPYYCIMLPQRTSQSGDTKQCPWLPSLNIQPLNGSSSASHFQIHRTLVHTTKVRIVFLFLVVEHRLAVSFRL